jgi:hypothetical protein
MDHPLRAPALITWLLGASLLAAGAAGCRGGEKPRTAETAYREVIAGASVEAAGAFFRDFPESPLGDRLVDDLAGWVRQAGDPALEAALRSSLPAARRGQLARRLTP